MADPKLIAGIILNSDSGIYTRSNYIQLAYIGDGGLIIPDYHFKVLQADGKLEGFGQDIGEQVDIINIDIEGTGTTYTFTEDSELYTCYVYLEATSPPLGSALTVNVKLNLYGIDHGDNPSILDTLLTIPAGQTKSLPNILTIPNFSAGAVLQISVISVGSEFPGAGVRLILGRKYGEGEVFDWERVGLTNTGNGYIAILEKELTYQTYQIIQGNGLPQETTRKIVRADGKYPWISWIGNVFFHRWEDAPDIDDVFVKTLQGNTPPIVTFLMDNNESLTPGTYNYNPGFIQVVTYDITGWENRELYIGSFAQTTAPPLTYPGEVGATFSSTFFDELLTDFLITNKGITGGIVGKGVFTGTEPYNEVVSGDGSASSVFTGVVMDASYDSGLITITDKISNTKENYTYNEEKVSTVQSYGDYKGSSYTPTFAVSSQRGFLTYKDVNNVRTFTTKYDSVDTNYDAYQFVTPDTTEDLKGTYEIHNESTLTITDRSFYDSGGSINDVFASGGGSVVRTDPLTYTMRSSSYYLPSSYKYQNPVAESTSSFNYTGSANTSYTTSYKITPTLTLPVTYNYSSTFDGNGTKTLETVYTKVDDYSWTISLQQLTTNYEQNRLQTYQYSDESLVHQNNILIVTSKLSQNRTVTSTITANEVFEYYPTYGNQSNNTTINTTYKYTEGKVYSYATNRIISTKLRFSTNVIELLDKYTTSFAINCFSSLDIESSTITIARQNVSQLVLGLNTYSTTSVFKTNIFEEKIESVSYVEKDLEVVTETNFEHNPENIIGQTVTIVKNLNGVTTVKSGVITSVSMTKNTDLQSYRIDSIVISSVVDSEDVKGYFFLQNQVTIFKATDATSLIHRWGFGRSNTNCYVTANEQGSQTVELAISQIPTTAVQEAQPLVELDAEGNPVLDEEGNEIPTGEPGFFLYADIYRFDTQTLKWKRRPNARSVVSPLTAESGFVSYHATPQTETLDGAICPEE